MNLRLTKLIFRFPWLFMLALVFYEISAIFLIFQLQFLARFFDLFIFKQIKPEFLTQLLVAILFFIFFRFIFIFLGDILSKKISQRIKSILRKNLVEKIVTAGNLMGKNSADLQMVMLDDVEAIDAYFSQFLPQICISFFVPLTLLVYVFPLDIISGLVFGLTAPLIPLFMVLIGKYSGIKNEKQLSVLHTMSAFFLDSIQGIKTIILLNQKSNHLERIKKVSEDYRKTTLVVLKTTFLSAFTLELLSTMSTAVIAVEIGIRLLYGRMTFENAFLILLIAPEFYLPLRNLGLRFHAAKSGIAAAKNIFKTIDSYNQQQNPKKILQFITNDDQKEPIIFQDVTFGYISQESLLENINLEIRRGEHISIVGPTGAGKSTILQLLMQFLTPSSGKIILGNKNIQDFSVEDWRNQFSWLPQSPIIINDSIRNNLRIANQNTSDAELINVLTKVDLWNLIDSFKEKLDTNLHEHGIRLSSGEMQRLCLGRILLRNRPIILLDEPTSSLDFYSEKRIIDILKNLPKTHTIVSIAHRLNTILFSDQVVFVNDKRVEAIGSHANLLSSNINYYNFCLAYFGKYL
ncbi:MAG: thiol reductant ABC exporter subunit CydD [Anaerolineaceae bacterium]